MLDKIAEIIPNIDKNSSIIVGFSDVGHTIDDILRISGSGPKLRDYFNVFVFSDNSSCKSHVTGGLPRFASNYAYCCQGTKEESDNPNSCQLQAEFKAQGAKTHASEMKGVGHKFDGSEFPKVAKWPAEVTLVSPDTTKLSSDLRLLKRRFQMAMISDKAWRQRNSCSKSSLT